MRRRFPVAILAAMVATAPLAAAAQDAAGKVHRIGILSPAASAATPQFEALRAGLSEHGLVEGRHFLLEFRLAQGHYDRLPSLAAELVRASDVIVAESTRAAHAAMAASAAIPIAAVVNSDPVASGLAASIARPGGNVTGVAMLAGELAEKRLELLHEMLPGARRMAALVRPPGTEFQAAMEHAGRSLGLTVDVIRVDTPHELQQVLASAALDQFDGVVVPPQSLFLAHQAEIVAALATKRRPAIYPDRGFVDEGGLMSYGPSGAEAFRRLASHVDRILKGAKPADLPIEQPTRFEVVVNLKTAKALGITPPPAVLIRADEVIE